MAEFIPGVDFQAAIEMCQLCQEEEAQFYCKDCQEEMCGLCKTAHIQSKVSRNHNVVSSTLGKSNAKFKAVKCTKHPRDILQMYCINCDEAVCVKCIAGTKHKNHNFEELQKILHQHREHISRSMSETKQQITELDKLLHTIDINVKDYTEESDKTINGINKHGNHIKSDVDKIVNGLIDQVQNRKKQDLQLKEREKKDIQQILCDQKRYLQSCEENLNSMNDFASIQHEIKKPKSNPLPSITHIKPLSIVSDGVLNLQDLCGKLVDSLETKSTPKTPEHEKTLRIKTISDDSVDHNLWTTVSTDVVSDFVFPDVQCYYVSVANENQAWCGSGNDLVLVDIHGQVKRKKKLQRYLRGIAVSSMNGEVFFTEQGDTNIKKYVPDRTCSIIADTQPHQPQDLCVTSQNDLLVALKKSGDDKVVRMTTTGHIKQAIQVDKQLKSLFTNPLKIAENINGDVVVADDFQPTSIVAVNKDGEYRYKYPDSSQPTHTMSKCFGIACDNTGCILVSDYGYHRIHQLDINGKLIQFILTQQHGILCPHGLSTDSKGRLWICNNGGFKVKVFKYKS